MLEVAFVIALFSRVASEHTFYVSMFMATRLILAEKPIIVGSCEHTPFNYKVSQENLSLLALLEKASSLQIRTAFLFEPSLLDLLLPL